MSDEVIVEAPKVTVHYSRKVTPKQYENAEAGVYIQVDTPLDPGAENYVADLVASIKEAFATAKAVVYDEVGIDYDTNPTTGFVVEVARRELGASVVEERSKGAPARKSPRRTPKDVDKTPYWKRLADELAKRESEDAYLPSFFDNTKDKRGNGPDYNTKNNAEGLEGGVGLWLNSAPEWFETASA